MEDADIAPESLFRPAKRRKFIRRRPDESTEETSRDAMTATSTDQNALDSQSKSEVAEDEDDSIRSQNLLRLRRQHPARKGGIGFSATSRSGDGNRETALSTVDAEKERIQAMTDRFTGNADQMVDVNRNMMAYIDSEMAKRYRRSPLPENDEEEQHQQQQQQVSQQLDEKHLASGQLERKPATLGRLHEIDLGQEAKLRNIARTEAATRKLTGEEGIAEQSTDRPAQEEKASWRNRKRRTSADIQRDRLVEEVLRESKLDVYDEPDDEPQLDDQAADDRVAEQFRRDFMDAVQSRRRARANAKTTNTKSTSSSKVEPPKGPKLGGSRSARAAMREMQNKAGQK